MTAELH